ncbi:MAG: beta-N-acetylhexosaminidase [Cellulomonas sp. 73-92]|nr:MAG: beta-N-acetylhexosaminidase [Cellulomonas sp. 73-92]
MVAVLALSAAVATWAAVRHPSAPPTAGPTASSTPTVSPTQASPTPTPAPSTSSPPADPLAGWSVEEKVGQLFVVGLDLGAGKPVSTQAVTGDHVGNVFLHGRSTAGVAAVHAQVAAFTALVSRATTHGEPMLVAVDQEGGKVQSLSGPGFSTIPAATVQATVAPDQLREQAAAWGRQLAAAGVNWNLAPVMDLVPASSAAQNPPVGALQRNYGTTVASVTTHAGAFIGGMSSAGVATAIKHFPGLGYVTANTDATAGVTDTVTGFDSAAVGVFRAGVEAGAGTVLMSTAVYSRMDPTAPAAFSSKVVQHGVREVLGFQGVVVTDDLSGATQVAAWSPGDRAIDAIAAGCDMVLFSKDPTVVHAAVAAVVAKAKADPAFAARVDESARRVLALKAQLLG